MKKQEGCKCQSMAIRLAGDGCEICNPELAQWYKERAEEEMEQERVQVELLKEELADYKKVTQRAIEILERFTRGILEGTDCDCQARAEAALKKVENLKGE